MIKQPNEITSSTGRAFIDASIFAYMLAQVDPDLPTASAELPEEYIIGRARFAQSLNVQMPVVGTRGRVIDPMTVTTENIILRKEIERINQKLVELEERMPQEKVIILREITREEAKQEIQHLFSIGRTLYYSDIAEELRLDLKLVVEICQELEEAGEVAVDDSAL